MTTDTRTTFRTEIITCRDSFAANERQQRSFAQGGLRSALNVVRRQRQNGMESSPEQKTESLALRRFAAHPNLSSLPRTR